MTCAALHVDLNSLPQTDGPELRSCCGGHSRCGERWRAWCRARVALKRVAGWLGVPWNKALAFEALLAHQAAAGRRVAGVPSAGRSAATWAKIGVASVGAGALFAVTGDARA